MQTVLAIDPSVNNLGWAVINHELQRLASGCWHPSKARGAIDRMDQLALQVKALIDQHSPSDVAVEIPSGGQRQSATQLMVYARAVGACEAAATLSDLPVHRIPVNMWKQSAKKSWTLMIVKSAMHHMPLTGDESDAIGLGLWFMSRRPVNDPQGLTQIVELPTCREDFRSTSSKFFP
jgi:Holliday junction resolvasome RuvABC endonuclease subunit